MTLAQGSRPRGRPRSEHVDRAILAATIDELTERGLPRDDDGGHRRAIRVAKSTVYRRWDDAAELGVAAVRSLIVEDEDYPPGSAREVLLALLDRMRRTWADPRYAALMRRVAADGTEAPDLYRSCRRQIIGPTIRKMNRALEQAVQEGLIRADADLEQVRQLLSSPIVAAGLTHKSRVTRAQVEFGLDTVLAGLRP